MSSITYKRATEYADPDSVISQAVPWVMAASYPYYEWLLGTPELAQASVTRWMKRPSSELYIRRVRFVLIDSEIAGGYLGMSGRELKKARMADAEALWSESEPTGRAALLKRIASTSNLFPPVSDDDFYMSKFGLNPVARGRGRAWRIAKEALRDVFSQGYSRLRLDVRADNDVAIRIYQALGCELIHTAQSADGQLKYQSMTITREAAENGRAELEVSNQVS